MPLGKQSDKHNLNHTDPSIEARTLRRIRIYLAVLALVLSSMVGGAVWWGWGDALNKMVYDQLLQFRPRDPPADVIIVAIDEYSLSHIGAWPWSRSYHAQLINHLTTAGVLAIGYDVVFAEPNPLDSVGDRALAEAIAQNGKVVLPVYIDRTQSGGQLIEVLPYPLFAEHAHMGHVNTELDEDGIVRRFYHFEGISDGFWPHFSTVVAQLTDQYQQPVFDSEPATQGSPAYLSPLLNVRRLPHLIPFLGAVGSFQQVSFYDVITGKVPPRLFKDRIVFVGATAISLGGLLPTPVTVLGEQMPGVEINATIYDATRAKGFITQVDPVWQTIASITFVLLTILLIPRVAGRSSLLFIVVSSLLVIALQAVGLLQFDFWFPAASALVGQWLVYPLWTVLRLDQTLRYLQKQLLALREELGQQSMADHHGVHQETFMERLTVLMAIVAVKNYQLYVNGRLALGELSVAQLNMDFAHLPLGPFRSENYFSCRYQLGENDYTLLVPVGYQAEWDSLKEAYVVGFFESEFVQPALDYKGTYDLVFEYLHEIRVSQVEVSNARILFEYCVSEMNDGVLIADEFGNVLFLNRVAQHYFAVNSIKGHSLLDLLTRLELRNDDHSWNHLFFSLITGRKSLEIEAVSPDKNVLLANLSYLDVGSDRANLVVINLYDITRIREAQRMRNETIDFLSHDMRSPMVSLLALVNQKRSQPSAEIDPEFLRQIENYANKNLYFAEQFLQLARVESDESIQFYEVDFEGVVRNAIDEVFAQAQAEQIELCLNSEDDLFWVQGNGELLERSVVNLLTNAIKYGPKQCNIDIELKKHGESLLLLVRDYGSGIPKEQQRLLFAPFQRLNNEQDGGQRPHKVKGAGLGLRFVEVTIKRHGGEAFVNSRPGRTEFGFTLPLLNMNL